MGNGTDSQGAVVITGASTGIGRSAALYLAERGYTVFAGVRKTAPTPSRWKPKARVSVR